MPSSIVLTGLASNDPVPGSYLEINFAQGIAAGYQGSRSILLMGNKLTAGSATADTVIYGPDTPVTLQTEQDAINLFGAGSELHRMFRRVTKVNQNSKLYAIAVTQSAGAQATLAITIATTATANGNLRLFMGDEFVDTAISNGDTIATIGANVIANVNAKTWWPVTASYSTGVITLTAKQNGPRGNWLRAATAVSGLNIGTTATGGTEAFFTGGTTADSNTTALSTILPNRYYYIVSAAEDATQAGALVTQVNAQAVPTVGIRQKAFIGSIDTLANAITIATGLNAARAKLVWLQTSSWTPAELAANQAAVEANEELATRYRLNFCFYGNDAKSQTYWLIPAPRLQTNWPTRTSIKSALNNGICPVGCNPNGSTYLVDRITTRSLNGGTNDYRIRDDHKVTICDFYSDDLLAKISSQFAGKQIGDDPPPGSRVPGPNVVTPRVFKAAINKQTAEYGENDLLQNVPTILSDTLAQRETNPTTRMSARIPLQPIDLAKQFAVAVDQVA